MISKSCKEAGIKSLCLLANLADLRSFFQQLDVVLAGTLAQFCVPQSADNSRRGPLCIRGSTSNPLRPSSSHSRRDSMSPTTGKQPQARASAGYWVFHRGWIGKHTPASEKKAATTPSGVNTAAAGHDPASHSARPTLPLAAAPAWLCRQTRHLGIPPPPWGGCGKRHPDAHCRDGIRAG